MAYDEYINAMQQQTASNNVFNAEQAQLNRDFQLEMSNTAHQREVKDLIAAGLNPILSANTGASTAAGSHATADTSSAQGFANLAATGLNNVTQLALAEINKQAQLEAARISANAVMQSAATAASASMYGSDQNTMSKPLGMLYKISDAITSNISGGKGLLDFYSGNIPGYFQLSSGMFKGTASKAISKGALSLVKASRTQQEWRYR